MTTLITAEEDGEVQSSAPSWPDLLGFLPDCDKATAPPPCAGPPVWRRSLRTAGCPGYESDHGTDPTKSVRHAIKIRNS